MFVGGNIHNDRIGAHREHNLEDWPKFTNGNIIPFNLVFPWFSGRIRVILDGKEPVRGRA